MMRRAISLILWCVLVLPAQAALLTENDTNVLLLMSYDPLFPSASDTVDIVRAELADVHLHVEFMDSKHHSDAEYLDSYHQLLQHKIHHDSRYDLVLAFDDNALRFIDHYRARLFSSTPVVFAGVSNAKLIRKVRKTGGYSGLYEALPLYEMVALIKRLYPDQDTLHIVADNKPTAHAQWQRMQEVALSLKLNLQLHSLEKLNWQQLVDNLNQLGQVPILALSAYEDVDSQTKEYGEALQFLSSRVKHGIMHLWRDGIEHGMLGGISIDNKLQARYAADIARRVLAGEDIDKIGVRWSVPAQTVFNHELFIRQGLDISVMPENTEWLSFAESFWARNKAVVFLMLSLAVFLGSVYFFYRGQVQRRLTSERLLDENTELLHNILNSLPDIIFYKNLDGVYQECNETAAKFMGYPAEKISGKTDYDIFDHEVADFFRKMDNEAVQAGRVKTNEEWVQGADGELLLLETQKRPLFDKHGKCTGLLGYSRDITEVRQSQKKLEHIAHHDALTNLPNRLLLSEQLEYALQLAKRSQSMLAVIFLDLDRFKDINDTIGHAIGDLLLKDVAQRLQSNIRESDICARLGGDEFVVVLTHIDDEKMVADKCEQLLKLISQPYSLQGHLVSVFASGGVSLFPAHGDSAESLIRDADAALHKAKELGRNRYCYFEAELSSNRYTRMTLEQDLRSALEAHQFTLAYQPQFRMGEKQPRRVEALLRWPHPIHGNISPHDFIPLAETSGLISELGYWVIRSACQQFLFWRNQGLQLDKLAINVSAIQINASFADEVAEILSYLKFDPHWLELEVTESLMMSSTTEVSQQVNQLREQGIEFSIDDFGTGYSSLSKIKSMPVTVLKIDQSFVRDINDDVNDYEIARAIILMARSLGLTVVAEGVETKEQENTLQRLGCEWVQGFYYAMPMDGEAFFRLYDRSHNNKDG